MSAQLVFSSKILGMPTLAITLLLKIEILTYVPCLSRAHLQVAIVASWINHRLRTERLTAKRTTHCKVQLDYIRKRQKSIRGLAW